MSLETPRLILSLITPNIIREKMSSLTKEEFKIEFGCEEPSYLRYQDMVAKGMETHRLSVRYFLIKRKEDGITMGECGFHTWNIFHRRAELFYALNRDEYKRQGYVSEALPVIIDYGFREMNLHRIEALIADENTPSKKLLLKNKFRFEGIMREDYVVNDVNTDSHCYSMLKSEWSLPS